MRSKRWKDLLFFLVYTWVALYVLVAVEARAQNLGEADKIFVKEIAFTGNTILDSKSLQALIKDFLNKELSLVEMNEAAQKVTSAYKEKGYILGRAVVQEQEVKDGVLTITVIEGKIGNVGISGNTYYNERVFKRYFEPQRQSGIMQESLLEKGVLLTKELYGAETNVLLKKGELPGTSDLEIQVKDRVGLKASVDANNYGSESTSRNRYGTNIEIIEPWWGSTFGVRGGTGSDPKDTYFGGLSYMVPLDGWGTRFGLNYIRADFAAGKDLADLGINGYSEVLGLKFCYPLLRKRDWNANLALTYDSKKSTVQQFDLDIAKDYVKVSSILFDMDLSDRFLGKNILSAGLSLGKIDIDDKIAPSRLDPSDDFVKFWFDFTRIQSIYGATNLLLRFSSQFSNDRLLPIEQYCLGGYGSIRGHKLASYLGDWGYTFTGELMFPPPFVERNILFGQSVSQLVQFAIFLDTGRAYTNSPPQGEEDSDTQTGYGAGVRLFYKNFLKLRFDVAFPAAFEEGKGRDIYYYLMLSYDII